MKDKKIELLFLTCQVCALDVNIDYSAPTDISIEIMKRYGNSPGTIYYTDGNLKLGKAVKKALKFLKKYKS